MSSPRQPHAQKEMKREVNKAESSSSSSSSRQSSPPPSILRKTASDGASAFSRRRRRERMGPESGYRRSLVQHKASDASRSEHAEDEQLFPPPDDEERDDGPVEAYDYSHVREVPSPEGGGGGDVGQRSSSVKSSTSAHALAVPGPPPPSSANAQRDGSALSLGGGGGGGGGGVGVHSTSGQRTLVYGAVVIPAIMMVGGLIAYALGNRTRNRNRGGGGGGDDDDGNKNEADHWQQDSSTYIEDDTIESEMMDALSSPPPPSREVSRGAPGRSPSLLALSRGAATRGTVAKESAPRGVREGSDFGGLEHATLSKSLRPLSPGTSFRDFNFQAPPLTLFEAVGCRMQSTSRSPRARSPSPPPRFDGHAGEPSRISLRTPRPPSSRRRASGDDDARWQRRRPANPRSPSPSSRGAPAAPVVSRQQQRQPARSVLRQSRLPSPAPPSLGRRTCPPVVSFVGPRRAAPVISFDPVPAVAAISTTGFAGSFDPAPAVAAISTAGFSGGGLRDGARDETRVNYRHSNRATAAQRGEYDSAIIAEQDAYTNDNYTGVDTAYTDDVYTDVGGTASYTGVGTMSYTNADDTYTGAGTYEATTTVTHDDTAATVTPSARRGKRFKDRRSRGDDKGFLDSLTGCVHVI